LRGTIRGRLAHLRSNTVHGRLDAFRTDEACRRLAP
jgi:hypothetical protein